MDIINKIPITIEDRLKWGISLQVKASWEEFLEYLPQCEYRIEYNNGEIISFMGFGTDEHEGIIANLIRFIGNLLPDEYRLRASNLAIHIPTREKKYFNADITIMKGSAQKVPLSKNMYSIKNPVLLVEVLSKSTQKFDQEVKLRHYRNIASLQQILVVDSRTPYVESHLRQGHSEKWLLEAFSQETDNIPIVEEGYIQVEKIYRNL